MYRWLLFFSAVVPATGCTNLALQRNTLQQAESLTDLRYQEVMENLAMIAANPATLPSFSSIYAGTADVSDTASVSSGTVLLRTLSKPVGSATNISTETADVVLSRSVKENWTLDPVVVPEKLRAMRLACWWALCGPEVVTNDYNVYLTKYQPRKPSAAPKDPKDPRQNSEGDPEGYYFDVADRLANLERGWVHVTCRRDVPRDAAFQAHCGDVYVWVAHTDIPQLSEFTLVIQQIARTVLPSIYNPRPVVFTYKTPLKDIGPYNTLFGNATMSVSIDEDGRLVSGPSATAIPRKDRLDNLGLNAELRSQIINAKTP